MLGSNSRWKSLSVCLAAAIGLFVTVAPVALSQPLTVSHLAGSAGGMGYEDGTGTAARFNAPWGVAVDGSGNVYVADRTNQTIRKVTPAGVVTTVAGRTATAGSADGPGSLARFNSPLDIAVDGSGNLYVADSGSHTIRKVTAAGVVTTLAGQVGETGSEDGPGSAARFNSPSGVAVDGPGNVYVADKGNNTIRKVTAAGVVTTLAGLAGTAGSADGGGSVARFYNPSGVAVDAQGSLYVADQYNHTIRKVTAAGVVTTLAGLAGTVGWDDGVASAARFAYPAGVAVEDSGSVWVADTSNNTIRKVTQAGVVTTAAGNANYSSGYVDGAGTVARFRQPGAVAVDGSGNVFVADTSNSAIRKVTPSGSVTTLAGQGKSAGSEDGPGTVARFDLPTLVSLDGSGNLYVADQFNQTIRKVTSAGLVTTVAGLAGKVGSVDGTGSAARFNNPYGVASDTSGTLYVADTRNHTIRKVTPTGAVTTLAGLAGESGTVDGTGSAARFNMPYGISVDGSGNLYVGEQENNTIRKVTPAGVVTTLAGLPGTSGSADGTGSAARFNWPHGTAVDGSGNVFVADLFNHAIRKVTPAGVVTTLAGLAGMPGSADGTGSAARFVKPNAVAVDGSGNVWVADSGNNTIRKVTSSGVVTTVAGKVKTYGDTNGTGTAALLNEPLGVAVDGSGIVYVADSWANRIRVGVPSLADSATVDATAGPVGTARKLDTSPQTATSWAWEEIRVEAGSAAKLSATGARNPTFTPDIPGYYLFRVTSSDGTASRVSDVGLSSFAKQDYLSLSSSHVSVRVSWRNQYSGEKGQGWPIPKGDAYGFFYFSSPSNPEVFVKVLDFGADSSYVLFWSGLTDFEYTVSFMNEATGKVFQYTKPAGSTDGGASKDLPHTKAVRWDAKSGKATEIAPGEYIGLENARERLGRMPVDASLAKSPDGSLVSRAIAGDAPLPEAETALLLDGGQISVTATWWSQYSQQSGSATPLPQDDQFGFFYISDPGNPEIFVKSLDWGKDTPFRLFATGLTDYEYTVTYTNVKTGQKVVFKKPAGGYQGFADGTQMNH